METDGESIVSVGPQKTRVNNSEIKMIFENSDTAEQTRVSCAAQSKSSLQC